MPCPKPEKNESKQSYLHRCVQSCTSDGLSAQDAFSQCTLAATNHNLSMATGVEQLFATVQLLESENAPAAPKTFGILAYTGQVVQRWWGDMIFELSGMRVAKNSIPALLNHDVDRIVGHTSGHAMQVNGLHIQGQFSKVTASAKEVLALAEEKFPWQASIGVLSEAIVELKKDAQMIVNGQTVTGPMTVVLQSVVQEISFVPLGADNNTAAIVMSATQEPSMSETTPPPHTVPAQAENLAAHNPAPAPTASPQAAVMPAAPQQADNLSAINAERERVTAILQLCATHHLSNAQDWIANGLSLDAARGQALDLLAAQPGNAPVGRVDTGMAEGDRFRALAAEGIAMSRGLQVQNPQEGSRQFMGMGLADMARMALERAGCNTLGMSRSQLARQVLSPQYRLSASVSDFSAVYMDVGNKLLLQAYVEAGGTFRPWTSKVNATDFKSMYGISLSEAPDLDKIGENEEYKTGSLKDHVESYRIHKYGKILSITFEMIVNDDLNAFSRIPGMLGVATARKHSDIVYDLLTKNVLMADGKALFSTEHNNTVAATGITDAGMNKARLQMRMQQGLNGARLNLSPSFLLVPPSLENTAYVLLKSAALPQEGMSAGVYNPWGDSRITPIVEQRIEHVGEVAKPWYLVASPSQVSTIDVAYLDGNEAPEISEEMSFSTDAFNYKARTCMGAGVVDYRGFVKNPGVKI